MTHKKQTVWFKKVRGSYLPCSWQGALTYIPFLAFLVTSLVLTLRQQTSLAMAVLLIFPQWVAAAVVMTWLASRTS
jgi:hypothetical protein